jgi:hypothetical protein
VKSKKRGLSLRAAVVRPNKEVEMVVVKDDSVWSASPWAEEWKYLGTEVTDNNKRRHKHILRHTQEALLY